MRQCKLITGWTDYPFIELGDTSGQKAPIRHVKVIRYDGDKYVTVSFENCGDWLSMKACYLYRQRGRLGQVKQINRRKLERMKRSNARSEARPVGTSRSTEELDG